jgi:hypothetical protein
VAEQNNHQVRQEIEDIWNGGDLALADRLFAPDYINHGGLIPDLVHGPEAIKVSVVVYRTAFPRLQVTVIDFLAQGQAIALRWVAHREPQRAGGNDAPDEAPDALRGMTFGRVSGGQIVESWTCWEPAGLGEFASIRELRTLARSA